MSRVQSGTKRPSVQLVLRDGAVRPARKDEKILYEHLLLSRSTVADMFDKETPVIDRYVSLYGLPHIRVGRREVLFPAQPLLDWLRDQTRGRRSDWPRRRPRCCILSVERIRR